MACAWGVMVVAEGRMIGPELCICKVGVSKGVSGRAMVGKRGELVVAS